MMTMKHALFILSALLVHVAQGAPAPQETPCQTIYVTSIPIETPPSFTTTLTSTTLLTSVVIAPLPVSTNATVPEIKAGVFVCEHHSWGGRCEYKQSKFGSAPEDCVVLDGRTSSIGPDEGIRCIFYTSSNCRSLTESDSIEFMYPGNSDLLVTPKGDFNDKLHSYHCFKI